MKRKPMEKVLASMKRISQGSFERFLNLKEEFE